MLFFYFIKNNFNFKTFIFISSFRNLFRVNWVIFNNFRKTLLFLTLLGLFLAL